MDVQSITTLAIAVESATLQGMQKPMAQLASPILVPPHTVQPAGEAGPSDNTGALVADVAAPAEIAHITALLESQRSQEVVTRIDALSSDAAAALAAGDHARALANVTEIAALDPHAVEPLRTDALLEPIRPEVDQLVNRLTTVAKMNAEGWLTQADDAASSLVQASFPNAAVIATAPTQLASAVLNTPETPVTALPGPVKEAMDQAIARSVAMQQPAVTAARIMELTHDTALALREGDGRRAMANVTEITALDAHAIESLRTDKVFTSMRPELDHLSTRVEDAAKVNAGVLASPASSEHASLLAFPVRPETLLHVAHRLFEAGGYANYVRSGDLAQSIVNPLAYSPFLAQWAMAARSQVEAVRIEDKEGRRLSSKGVTARDTMTALRAAATPRLYALWRRAPLLVLLLGWLSGGVVAGCAAILLRGAWPDTWPAPLIDFGFNVWATGFLLLVCFGFYARIRQIRI